MYKVGIGFITALLIVAAVAYSQFFVQTGKEDPIDETIAPTIQPVAVDVSNEPLYTHPGLGWKIRLPDDYRVELVGDYSVHLRPDVEVTGQGATNFIYISVVPPQKRNADGEVYNYFYDDIERLRALATDESVSLAGTEETAYWFTYTKVDEVRIANELAGVYENRSPWEFPTDTTEVRLFFEKEGTLYLLGFYAGGEGVSDEASVDPRLARGVLESFITE